MNQEKKKGLSKTETQVGGNLETTGNLETIQARSSEVEKGGNITSEGITNDGSAMPMSHRSLEEMKERKSHPEVTSLHLASPMTIR